MAPPQSALSLLQSVVGRPQMEKAMSSETGVQSAEDGWMFTERDIVLSRTVTLVLQSILVGAFAVSYLVARSAALRRSESGPLYVERQSVFHLGAVVVMWFLTFVNLFISGVRATQPVGGYEGKLDVPYKTFEDEYALFLSVNGTQFYLYVTQTMIANALMAYILHVKSDCKAKARSSVTGFAIFGTIFGYCAGAGPLLAFEFLFLTAAVNVVTSVCVIRASLRNRNSDSDSESSVVRRPREFYKAMIQSGAVYTVASLSLVVTFSMDPNVLFNPTMCITSPLMGIAFSLAVINQDRSGSSSSEASGNEQLPASEDDLKMDVVTVTEGSEEPEVVSV